MNSPVFLKILAFLCIAQLLVSCSSSEVCDENGIVYTYLLAHGDAIFADYSTQYGSLAPLFERSVFFSIKGQRYSARSVNTTDNRQIVLSVSTNEGYPATPLGASGYFYTATGELNFTDETYETQRMSQYIFCYQKN